MISSHPARTRLRLSCVAALFAVASFAAALVFVWLPRANAARAMRYVVHAAGELDGVDRNGNASVYTVSNSAEGLKQCADAGVTAVELDFNFTADSRLVCLHDWYHMYADEIETGVALSYEDFRAAKIFRQFTSIGIEEVATFLGENPGVYVVTDIKDGNLRGLTALAEQYPSLRSRFIVQIYAEDEYDEVRALGFDKIVFSLYRLTWLEKTDAAAIGEFARRHPLVGITFSSELCEIDGYVERMKSLGVPLFVHTVNGEDEQAAYFDAGIAGVYTDEVKVAEGGNRYSFFWDIVRQAADGLGCLS